LRVKLADVDIEAIKRVIIETGSPIIPLTLIFEALGFPGATGIEWGILAGAITATATELGYQVQKIGRSIILVQKMKKEKKIPLVLASKEEKKEAKK